MVARYKLHEGIMLGLTRQKKRNKFLCYFSRFFVARRLRRLLFARTLPSKMANLLRLGKKKNKFFCFALDFS